MSIFEKSKELTNDMNSIELQLKGEILPKPMNDFKDVLLKADFWQSQVIREIMNTIMYWFVLQHLQVKLLLELIWLHVRKKHYLLFQTNPLQFK